jgi:hypothetical protein
MERHDGILQLTWAEIEIAALCIGIRSNTIRQWRHRNSIPARAQLRIIEHFGRRFMVADWPAGANAVLGRPSLADYAAALAGTTVDRVRRGD